MDDRTPDRKYAFPNEEMIEQEEKLSQPDGAGKKAKPEDGRQARPQQDLATPFESQGIGLYDVPPADQTVPTER